LKTAEFDYHLPEDRIAQTPLAERAASRLLVVRRDRTPLEHRSIVDLPLLLSPGTVMVFNDSRVFRARLWAQRKSGGRVEILLIEKIGESTWRCMLRASKGVRTGEEISVLPVIKQVNPVNAVVIEPVVEGRTVVRLPIALDLNKYGEPPLPPYIHRAPDAADDARYQTVFAKHEGSIAAPTAGLHFDEALLKSIDERGVIRRAITLHIGPGTFMPVRSEDVREHRMEAERYQVHPETANTIAAAKINGRTILAVGTTAMRALEASEARAGEGRTDLFITPGYSFKTVTALLTNFHLPKSTLLMLVCAFGGKEIILEAYEEAKKKQYRFYSYGDAMLIL
jgi:S-adenosylmethionine:tRNA ribosyltransferase-isomerase